jgi:hypothetical protein
MNNGVMTRAVSCGLLGIVLAGCGSTDNGNNGGSAGAGPNMTATADCGSLEQPRQFTISDVSPALGASVPNTGVVQRFTIVGQYLQIDNGSFALSAAHTAGAPTPTPIVWTYAPSGGNTVYTSAPITWQTAPGHVEFVPAGLLETADGCVSTFPTPVFSYDVTAP